MAMLCRQIIELTEEFETEYLKNQSKNDSKNW